MLRVQLAKRRGDFQLQAEFEVDTPGVIALFGRSGCGKSTVIELLAGLLTADDGRVQLDELTLFDSARGVDLPAEQRRLGVVFQEGRLFPHLDVTGNLMYGARRAPREGRQVTRVEEVVALLGIGGLLDRRVHQLSGGERQRVALGRALLSQPRMLLLDEPLSALEVSRREEVLPYLERLRDALAIPIVYVSHQFDEVIRLATRVVLMEQGQVLASGDLSTISRLPQLREIVGSDAVGAVVNATVEAQDGGGLATLRVGQGQMRVELQNARPGQQLPMQVLARDVVIATEAPRALSVRNALAATVVALTADAGRAVLVELDVGGATLLARITALAAEELALAPGHQVWALIKSVSLRGHVFAGRN